MLVNQILSYCCTDVSSAGVGFSFAQAKSMIKNEPSLMQNPDGLLIGSASPSAISTVAHVSGYSSTTTTVTNSRSSVTTVSPSVLSRAGGNSSVVNMTNTTSVKDLIDSTIENALTNQSQLSADRDNSNNSSGTL